MFVGREKEIRKLKEQFNSPKKSVILVYGKKRYKEISSFLGINDTGLLDKQLKNLLNMETVSKVFPINKKDDRKKVFYQIKDNLMRFYFAYIFANESLLSKFGSDGFFEKTIKPSLDTFISYRFEEIVIQFFMIQVQKGKMLEIEDFGTFWYDDKETGTNGQFDCVLKEKDGYDFFEAKFLVAPMSKEMCQKEEEKIKKFKISIQKKSGSFVLQVLILMMMHLSLLKVMIYILFD